MRSILLALALATAYALLRGWPEGVHPLVRSCLAVLALVVGLGMWRKRRFRFGPEAKAIRAAHWTDYLAMGLGVLGIECLFLFFLTTAPPRAEALALGLEASLRPEMAAARRAANEASGNGPATNVSGNWLWDSMGRRQLPNATNARPGNRPEVFFKAADQTTATTLQRWRPYVAAFSLEVYDNAIWSPEPITPRALSADPDGTISLPQPSDRPGPLLSGEIFHSANAAGQDVLTTLQNPVQVTLSELRRVSPGIVRLTPLPNPGSGYKYTSSSRPLSFAQLAAEQRTDWIRPGTNQPDSLLALPSDPELRTKILQIANRTPGPLDIRLAGIRRFLRESTSYSLKVENPDQRDPIDNFLFHEQRGHCEFYATSAALLCRALNIPSRVSYGWAGGRYFAAQNLFMFRAREAHAWTEIYLADLGWVIFDCTPPGALDAAQASIANANEEAPLNEDGNIIEDEDGEEASLGAWPWFALGSGLSLLPLMALVLGLRHKPSPGSSPDTTLLVPDPPGYLTSFKNACRGHGLPMPPGRTLRQQIQFLEQEELAPPFAEELLAYHYATTYADSPSDRHTERHLTKEIRSW